MEDQDDSLQIHQTSFERSISFERVASLAEDQASMTIEFLRARLLSERSVSKAARQRTQQLAKKVAELEQHMEAEMQLRKKFEAARREVLSRHKADLGEEFVQFYINVSDRAGKEGQDLNLGLEEGSEVRSEHERSSSNEVLNTSEGTKSGQGGQNGDGDRDGEYSIEEDLDRLAREKGSLAWASRRGHKRLQDKEWARRFRQFSSSLSPMSCGAPSPDSESPRRRWVGKSVRQIRTRTVNQDLEGNAEVKQDPAEDFPLSDEEKEAEVEKALEQQTELIERFEAEENAQRAWEEKYREKYPLKERSGDQDGSSSRRDKEILFKPAEDEIQERLEFTVVKGVGTRPSREHGGPHRESLESFPGGQADQTTMVEIMAEEVNDSAEALVLPGSKSCEEGAVEDANIKVSMEGSDIDVPCNGKPENVADDCHAIALGYTQEAKSSLSHVMKPVVDMSEEVLDNQIEHLHSNLTSSHDGSRVVTSSSKFDASSLTSSQGSNSGALSGATHQRQDLYSIHPNNLEQLGGMSRESSERRSMNRDNSLESFVQSPSTSDNNKAMKAETYKDMAQRSPFSSPAKSNGSSKSLMNSSWDEIFKRKIKAQEAGQVEQATDQNTDSTQMHSKHPFSHWFDPSIMSAPYNDHSIRSSHGAHEERRRHHRMYCKSVDAGLDKVMEVLRALEIAKSQVEGSNEHVMESYGYAPLHYIPHGTSYQPLPAEPYGYAPLHYIPHGTSNQPWPAGGMDPYFYDMENMRARMAVGYVPSPSRQPTNMQHTLVRGDPMVEQAVWSQLRSYAHPNYAGRHG